MNTIAPDNSEFCRECKQEHIGSVALCKVMSEFIGHRMLCIIDPKLREEIWKGEFEESF